MAKRISGVRYALKENPQGATQVRFEFPGGAESRLTLSTTKGDLDLVVGLDGVYRVADTGSYGTMPGDDNHYAVRGTWVDGHTFEFESIELGNPNHAKSVVTFTDETIEMEIVIQPLDRTLRLEGAKEGSGATG